MTISNPVDTWLERSDRIFARLQKITASNPVRFLRGIVEKFLENHDKNEIYNQVVEMGKLQKSIYKYENEVLTLAGLGTEYDKVKRVTQQVCQVIRWVEEVLCLAMVEATEVQRTFEASRLLFQVEAPIS
jgi:hypothetical protein